MTINNDSSPDLLLVERGDGEHFDVAGARLTWKVKAEMTQERFCFFEQVLQPGDAVPLHRHGFTENFYILSGNVTFAGATENSARLLAQAGDVVWRDPEPFTRSATRAMRKPACSASACPSINASSTRWPRPIARCPSRP
jgi:hypothetical protein